MSLDGLAIRSLARELKEKLTGGRIDKLSQPNPQTLTFQVRTDNQTLRLLASINPQNARLVLTQERFENPTKPPLFVMVIRKHLTNAIISDIRQLGYERMIEFLVEGRNEIGEKTTFSLIFELMGKNSNVILRKMDNIILDAMRKVGANTNQYRQIQPGLAYIMPPSQDKVEPFELSEEDFSRLILAHPSQMSLEKALLSILGGFGPQSVRELIYCAGLESETRIEYLGEGDYRKLYFALEKMKTSFLNNSWQPEVRFKEGSPFTFAPFCLTVFDTLEQKPYKDLSSLLENYYRTKEAKERFMQRKQGLLRIIRHEIERCEKKYAIQLSTIAKKEECEIYRIYGELLTANLYRIKQGESASVENFYEDNKPITIPLDPEKTPNDNAQAYFKIYNRAKNGAEQASLHAQNTKEELTYLQSIVESLDLATEANELNEIRRELGESGYAKKEPTKKKKQDEGFKLLQTSFDDYDIFIGKNNLQNDYLTLKFAKNKDLWLHTKDIHGAHVIVKAKEQKSFSDEVILYTAELAAYYSKARLSSQVPVDYTLIKYVHKPSGAKPGMVIYTDQKTVFVKPNAHQTNLED